MSCFITSAERKVKDSRGSEMYQSRPFWDKIGNAKFVGFRFFRLFDEWEPNWFEISRDHFDFFDLFFNLFEEEKIIILAFSGFEPTQLFDPSDQRRL